ncbi:transposase [Pelagibaca abyssi]|nr:transposase [Salipiger abyssi]
MLPPFTVSSPQLTSNAVLRWQEGRKVEWHDIAPGNPMRNGLVESVNGRFRDECLDQHLFSNLRRARNLVAAWRDDYNHRRPPHELRRAHTVGVSPTLNRRRIPEQSEPKNADSMGDQIKMDTPQLHRTSILSAAFQADHGPKHVPEMP